MGVIQTLDGLMNNPTPEGRVDDILRPEGDNPLLEKGFVTTSVDALLNWARTGSMWPMTFGLACCAPADDEGRMQRRKERQHGATTREQKRKGEKRAIPDKIK